MDRTSLPSYRSNILAVTTAVAQGKTLRVDVCSFCARRFPSRLDGGRTNHPCAEKTRSRAPVVASGGKSAVVKHYCGVKERQSVPAGSDLTFLGLAYAREMLWVVYAAMYRLYDHAGEEFGRAFYGVDAQTQTRVSLVDDAWRGILAWVAK